MEGTPSIERRALRRYPGDTFGPVEMHDVAQSESFLAQVIDISVRGVAVRSANCLPPGTLLAVSGQWLGASLTAEVRYCRELTDRSWLLGCEFSRALTSDDIFTRG